MAVLAVLVGAQLFSSSAGFKKVDTSTVVQAVEAGNVKSAKLIDGEQRAELTLKSGDPSRITAQYVPSTGDYLAAKLRENPPPEGFDEVNPQQSTLITLLFSLLPIAIIVFLFL